jgi:hypothetical protein
MTQDNSIQINGSSGEREILTDPRAKRVWDIVSHPAVAIPVNLPIATAIAYGLGTTASSNPGLSAGMAVAWAGMQVASMVKTVDSFGEAKSPRKGFVGLAFTVAIATGMGMGINDGNESPAHHGACREMIMDTIAGAEKDTSEPRICGFGKVKTSPTP